MPAEVAEDEPIEPLEDIDILLIEFMLLMVDVGLMVTELGPAAELVVEEIDPRAGPGENEAEILIPGGT